MDESLDSLRPIEILSMLSSPRTVALLHFLLFVFFASHSSIHILFRLPHFARVTSFKKNWATEKLALHLWHLECIAKLKGFLEIRV